jgi:membrane-associated phospholipid phosphatase
MLRRPLISAAVCAALGAAVYLAAVHIPAVANADLRTLEGFMGLWVLPGAHFSVDLIQLFDPAPFAILAGSLVVWAIVAGRTRAGAVAALTMLGAGVTTQLLKPLLATQREYPIWHWMGPEAYPSGHTTAAMSFALALVIISPARRRPLAAAAGGLLTAAMIFSLLVLGSHYPSDVAGGLLVATGWACLSTAALRLELRASLGGPALAATILAAAGLLVVVLRPVEAFAYAAANTTFVAGALMLFGAALVLSGSVPAPTGARWFRRPPPDSPRVRG